MSRTRVWSRRHPVIGYFILAYALFWLVLALAFVAIGVSGVKLDALPAWVKPIIQIVGAWMPALAACMVTVSLQGRAGARRLFGRFLQFRLPAWAYLMAIIPFVLAFAAAAINATSGGNPRAAST